MLCGTPVGDETTLYIYFVSDIGPELSEYKFGPKMLLPNVVPILHSVHIMEMKFICPVTDSLVSSGESKQTLNVTY